MKILLACATALTLWVLVACSAPVAPMTVPSVTAPVNALPPAKKQLSIGSFDSARGGIESLQAADEKGLKAAIGSLYHATFHYAPKLTTTFLSKVT